MNKNKLILILILGFVINSYSQTINEDLHYPCTLQTKEGLVLAGIKDGNNPVLKVTLYDKALTIIKTYSKELGANEICAALSIAYIGQEEFNANVSLQSNQISITFNESLEEKKVKTFPPFSMSEAMKMQKISKKQDKTNYIKSTLILSYLDKPKEYLSNDWFEINYKGKGTFDYNSGTIIQPLVKYTGPPVVRRFTPKNDDNILYTAVWETLLDAKKVGSASFIYINEQITIAAIKDLTENDAGQDYIYCFETKTGSIIYKTAIKPANSADAFFFSNAFYETSTGQLVVSGNIYDASQKSDKIKMNAMGIMVYNKKGELINSQKINFPLYDDVREPGPYDFKDNFAKILEISKLSSGGYFIHCENQSKRTSLDQALYSGLPMGASFYAPVGYSVYEMNNTFEITSSKFIMMKDFFNAPKRHYYDSSPDGKTILLSNTYSKKRNTEVVTFGSTDNTAKELYSFDFDDYSPKIDYCHQYLMDNSTIIIFYEPQNAIGCKLEVHKF